MAPAPMNASVVLLMTGTLAAAPMLSSPRAGEIARQEVEHGRLRRRDQEAAAGLDVGRAGRRVRGIVADEGPGRDAQDVDAGRAIDRDGRR